MDETGETVLMGVAEAAELLGISEQAVRKRIRKGQLAATSDGRRWTVILERVSPETGETATAQPGPKPPAHPNQAAQLAALIEPHTSPLVARIEALSREAERERLRADRAEAELAVLRETPKPDPKPPVIAPAHPKSWLANLIEWMAGR